MSAPMLLQPQSIYIDSALSTALVALAHFESLVTESTLPYSQQQKVHRLMHDMNLLSEEIGEQIGIVG